MKGILSSFDKYKDVLLYDQKIILTLNSEQKDFMSNKPYSTILQSLRNKPKTVDEISQFLSGMGINKSKKSVYRYLNELRKRGLILIAGKRVTAKTNNSVNSFNLYTRSAKFYFNYNVEVEPEDLAYIEVRNQFVQATTLFLETSYNRKIQSVKFPNILKEIFDKKEKALLTLMKDISNQKMEILQSIEWGDLSRILDVATIIKILLDTPTILENLLSVVHDQSVPI